MPQAPLPYPLRFAPLTVGQLDGQMMLIDGRNRREACRRAGIIPDHVLLDGQDPVAYIISANILITQRGL
jgi:hypothetical protein